MSLDSKRNHATTLQHRSDFQIHPFPNMLHGFMMRGPLEEPPIARDYAAGVQLALGFMAEHARSANSPAVHVAVEAEAPTVAAKKKTSKGRKRGGKPAVCCTEDEDERKKSFRVFAHGAPFTHWMLLASAICWLLAAVYLWPPGDGPTIPAAGRQQF